MAFWKFVNKKATEEKPEEIELWVKGEIIDDSDIWIAEWFEEAYTARNVFRNELAKYKGKDITLWIDSPGGDVFAASGMYTALMEHKKSGAIITAKLIECCSAATVVACAASDKTTYMSPTGLYMVHPPLAGLMGYFQSDELEHIAGILDTIKETIMNAYELKTGRSREDLDKLISAETYMGPKQAIAEGFVDGILYTEDGEGKDEKIKDFAFSRVKLVASMKATADKILAMKKDEEPIAADESEETEDPPDDGLEKARAVLALKIAMEI